MSSCLDCSKSFEMLDILGSFDIVWKMSKKTSQGARKARSKRAPAASAPARVVSHPSPSQSIEGPPPEVLFLEAESEPGQRSLAQYLDSIRVLRDKSFSYREIAEWLSERGVPADHNTVYRVYTKSLSDYHAHLEEQRADEEERDEALRNS